MAFTFTDRNKKTVLQSWGRFRAQVSEAVVAGDLVSFLGTGASDVVQFASEDGSQAADAVACEDGAVDETIWCAVKAVLKAPVSVGTGGAVTRTYFAAADDFLGSLIYLSTEGKVDETPGTTFYQPVGRLLARDRILIDLSPHEMGTTNFGKDDYGADVKMFADDASSYLLWDASAGRLVVYNVFDAAGDIATYQYASYFGMVFNTPATSGKYIAGVKVAVEGAEDFESGAAVWPIWIDYQGTGNPTNSSTSDAAVRISIQAGAHIPDTFFALQTTASGVPHLFKLITGEAPPWSTAGIAGTLGGTVAKISIELGGTEYFLVAATTIT